jgi:hypothetical protein
MAPESAVRPQVLPPKWQQLKPLHCSITPTENIARGL